MTDTIVSNELGGQELAEAPPRVPSSQSGKSRHERKVQYLAKRPNGIYCFVRRFPTEYVERGIFRQPAYRKSLGTRDPVMAAKAARKVAVRFDEILERLAARDARRGVAAATVDARLIHEDDVNAIAQRFESLLLYSDDLDRNARLTPEQYAEYLADVEKQRGQARDANKHGDFDAMGDEVRGFLEAENLRCDEGTETWRRLLKAMTQSQLRALRSILQRLDGDEPVATPEAHPPVRSDDDLDDLDRAFEHWIQKTRPKTKTIIEARSIFTRLKSFTGKSRISSLTRAELLKFQAAEAQRKVGNQKKQIRPQTVNKMLGLMRAVFKLACDDLLTSRKIENPLAGIRKEKVRDSDRIDRQDLSQEQLQALFSGPVHIGGFRPQGGAGEAAYWMPILAYTTGARMQELAQLGVGDVLLRDGVHCLWLTTREHPDLPGCACARLPRLRRGRPHDRLPEALSRYPPGLSR